MAFKVGQKVVCVNDQFKPLDSKVFSALPVKGQIYTIRLIYGPNVHGYGFLLAEITGMPWPGDGEERGFLATRFRPLVEKSTETGMAILRGILDRESIRRNAENPSWVSREVIVP